MPSIIDLGAAEFLQNQGQQALGAIESARNFVEQKRQFDVEQARAQKNDAIATSMMFADQLSKNKQFEFQEREARFNNLLDIAKLEDERANVVAAADRWQRAFDAERGDETYTRKRNTERDAIDATAQDVNNRLNEAQIANMAIDNRREAVKFTTETLGNALKGLQTIMQRGHAISANLQLAGLYKKQFFELDPSGQQYKQWLEAVKAASTGIEDFGPDDVRLMAESYTKEVADGADPNVVLVKQTIGLQVSDIQKQIAAIDSQTISVMTSTADNRADADPAQLAQQRAMLVQQMAVMNGLQTYARPSIAPPSIMAYEHGQQYAAGIVEAATKFAQTPDQLVQLTAQFMAMTGWNPQEAPALVQQFMQSLDPATAQGGLGGPGMQQQGQGAQGSAPRQAPTGAQGGAPQGAAPQQQQQAPAGPPAGRAKPDTTYVIPSNNQTITEEELEEYALKYGKTVDDVKRALGIIK